MVIQAEHFKADIATPKGNDVSSFDLEMLCSNDNDDDFFHIMCHVDPNLKTKIERGEFTDLEKLLAKNGETWSEDKRVELVNWGRSTYFTPVQDCETKITSV